ncbi:MAG: enoyl-CoA hydratase/isomerase family protein, partial [Beijerinckiaceae bacterium]
MSEGRLAYTTQNALARIVIEQPAKMNAMNFDMWSRLPQCVAQAEADAGVRAIVLEGADDKAFCAGA